MKNLIKKAFLISMVITLSLWGVVGVVAVDAQANVATTGDLITTTANPAVYYLSSDGKRYTFNHEREYMTWYEDFSGVVTVTNDEMFTYDLGGTVVVRPGARLMQYVSVQGDGTWMMASPNVYAVGPNGGVHALDNAETAVALYGENWEQMIVAIPDYLSGYYSTGTALTSASTYPTGTLVKMADATQVYYIDGTTKRPVTTDGMTGNKFNMDFVLTVSSLAGYTDGTSITGTEGDIANPTGGTTAPEVGTGLTVALSPASPGAQVAPGLATNVPLLKVNLTASADGAVTLNSLVFSKSGPSDNNDINYYYLYDGSTRLTSGKSINSNTLTVTFSNLNLSVTAGTTKTLTLSADIAALGATTATAGGVHIYSVVSADSIGTSAQVNGSFPISGNTTSIGSVSTGYLTVDKNGTLANSTVGQAGVVVAQFKVTNSSAEAMSIERIALYQAGSLENSKITNLQLYQGSTLLSETASINGSSLAVFELTTPFEMAKSQNKIFTVKADIAGSARNEDNIKFYLENESDLYAVGQTYGYGACIDAGTTICSGSAAGLYNEDTACTGTAPDLTCTTSSYSYVAGGQLSIANNAPSAGTVSVGQTEVELLKFAITAGVNTEIKSWRLELHRVGTDIDTSDTNCTNDYYSNIKISDDSGNFSVSAVNCSGMANITTTNNGLYKVFSDTVEIAAGETKNYTVTIDINSSATSDEVIYATLGNTASANSFSSTSLKNTDNNQWITDIVPTTYTQGTNQIVGSATLTTSLGNWKGEQTVVKGSTNVKFVEYNLTTGVASPVTINSIKWASYVDYDGSTGTSTLKRCYGSGASYIDAKDVVTKLRMFVGGVQKGIDQSIDTSGYVTFSSLNWVIPADTTITLELKGDISSNAYFNSNADRVAFDILTTTSSATYIDATDGDGNSITSIAGVKNGSDNGTTAGTATAGSSITMSSSYSYVTVQNTGTLNAFKHGASNDSLVVAGTSGVEVLKVKFHAIYENLTVSKIRFTAAHPASIAAIENVQIEYTDSNGDARTETASMIGAGYAQFNGQDIYVEQDGDAYVTVKVNYKGIGTQTATTGDPVKLFMNDGNTASSFQVDGADDGSNTVFYSTSNTLTNGRLESNLTIVRKTILSIAKNAVSNSLGDGVKEVYNFTVSATEGTANSVRSGQLKAMKMFITLIDNTLSDTSSTTVEDFTINNVNGQDLVVGTDYTFLNGYGGATTTSACLADGDTCTGTLTAGGDDGGNGTSTAQPVYLIFNSEQIIGSENPVTYTVTANFSNVNTASGVADSANFYLAATDSASTTYGYMEASSDTYPLRHVVLASSAAGTTEATASYIWSDYSGVDSNGSHSTSELTSNDWTNGYLFATGALGGAHGVYLTQ